MRHVETAVVAANAVAHQILAYVKAQRSDSAAIATSAPGAK
jgi:hypothetical protein